jgi:hypothetical protein
MHISGMHRQRPPTDPEVEALLDERDHLQIQISLFADEANTEKREAMLGKLAQIESEIHKRWKGPMP